MMSQPSQLCSHDSRIHLRSQFTASLAAATLLIFLAVSGASRVAAESSTITSEVSTNAVQVAEPLTVEWTVVAPSGAKVTFPEIGSRLGNFDVIDTTDRFDIPQAGTSDQRSWTRRLTLETIFAGDQEIPELEIQVRIGAASTAAEVLRTQPIAVRVASVLEDRADPTQFRDIESVVDMEVLHENSRSWVWWTLGSAGGLVVLAATGVLVAQRRARTTPENWALDELDEISAALAAGHAGTDIAASRASDILRDFLILQLGIPESGHTAQEVVHEMKLHELVADETLARLNSLFTLADNAKFGGLQLADEDVAHAITEAREIVVTIASNQRR